MKSKVVIYGFISFLFLFLSIRLWQKPTFGETAPYQFGSFSEYVDHTTQWLATHRQFTTINNHPKEVWANSPFEMTPNGKIRGAILLVHGLGDSPYTFREFAETLVQQGFVVRALLLPGHGSAPADMQAASIQNWNASVHHHTALLLKEYENVWLGGFSTGANLVTQQAYLHTEVKGLLLFSPGYKPYSLLAQFASVLSFFKTWAIQHSEDNPVRYTSQTFHGGAQYYQSSKNVRGYLESKAYTKPVYMVLAEDDTVIDPYYALEIFNKTFTHPKSQLLWFGEEEISDPRATSLPIRSQVLRISKGSHMFPLFSMENPHYGINSPFRLCRNGQSKEMTAKCKDHSQTIWYSGYGHVEEGKSHARLTFNPHYPVMTQAIQSFLETNGR